MNVPITDLQGNVVGEKPVAFELISSRKGTQAVHDAVVAHRATRRAGTASTKTVGEVAGTNRKPWRQKGTGRARAGSFRSPLWRGGGVVFGPKPRDYSLKVSKKTRQLALRKALSARLAQGDVVLVESLPLAAPKTREFVQVLAGLKLAGQTVLIVAGRDDALERASRNVPRVRLTTGENVNTYQLLWPEKLVFTRSAFEQVEQRLARK